MAVNEKGEIIRRRPPRRRPDPAERPTRPSSPRTRSKAPLLWTLLIIFVIGVIWLKRRPTVSPIKLQKAVICLDVIDREPQHVSTVFSENVKQIYCWTNVRNGGGRYINHTYYREGRWIHNQRLYIRANSRWRTWSSKKVSPGNWSVKITDDSGILLEELSFRISRGYSKQKSI